jgi:hypothetical protein
MRSRGTLESLLTLLHPELGARIRIRIKGKLLRPEVTGVLEQIEKC